jgi:hypothetical protein
VGQSATITVTTDEGNFTDECIVTVVPVPIPIDSLSFSPATITIGVNANETLEDMLDIDPSNATNTEMRWKSDNVTVASVDADTGEVYGHSNGTAHITATSITWGKSATIEVTVNSSGGQTYSVIYLRNNPPVAGTPSGSVPPTTEHQADDSVTVSDNTGNLGYTGYYFSHWNSSENGTGTDYYPGGTFIMPSENLLLYAVWKKTVTIKAIPGVVKPEIGAVPVTTAIDTLEYTGTISWSPSASIFAGSTVYTANIVLTPKAGFTFTGVTANFFTVAGATATNNANSGNVSAVFPATAANMTIGMDYKGGKLAYILQPGDPGYDANTPHGLIAAVSDQTTASGIIWARAAYQSTAVTGTLTTLLSGSENTDRIIAQNLTGTTYAAGLARVYNGGGYTDWYLPSIDELSKLYANRFAIGGFTENVIYWSSSEYNASNGRNYNFDEDYPGPSSGGKGYSYRVRAVRSF